MNTIYDDSIFCQFLPTEDGHLQCSNCGLKIKISSGLNRPPMFPCTKNLRKKPNDSEITFVQKIKNFAQSTIQHISSGMKQCSDEQIIKRHNICLQCEHFEDDTCTQCGCPLFRNKRFVSKLTWADQECPVGKWTKEL